MGHGTTDKVKGRTKEVAGAMTGEDGHKREGKVDRAKGTVKDKVGGAADKIKEAVKSDRR